MYKDILEKYKQFLLARNQSLVYFTFMRVFLSYIETKNIKMEEITQETITLFFNEKQYSTNSKNNFIKSGNSFYKFTGTQNNIWSNMTLMKPEKKIPQFLTEKDLQEALRQLGTYNYSLMHPIKLEAILNFMFYTGLRKSEITNIKRIDIDLENKRLIVRVPNKGKSERVVPMTVKLKNSLEKYFLLEEEKENALNINETQLEYLCSLISKYLKKHVTPHIFRHSFGRHLVMKGISLGIISKILGHSSVLTTQIYAEPDQQMIEDMFKQKMEI